MMSWVARPISVYLYRTCFSPPTLAVQSFLQYNLLQYNQCRGEFRAHLKFNTHFYEEHSTLMWAEVIQSKVPRASAGRASRLDRLAATADENWFSGKNSNCPEKPFGRGVASMVELEVESGGDFEGTDTYVPVPIH